MSAASGEKEVRVEPDLTFSEQVDSVLSADGRRPVRRGEYYIGSVGVSNFRFAS